MQRSGFPPSVAPQLIGATNINEGSRRGGPSEPPPNENPCCGGSSAPEPPRAVMDVPPAEFVCEMCHRSFRTKIGLGVHQKSAHPVEYNAKIEIGAKKPRWSEEETRVMAMEEAVAPAEIKAINKYLLERFGGARSLESIKCVRKRPDYKAMVASYKEQAVGRALDRLIEQPEGSGSDHADPERIPAPEDANGCSDTQTSALDWLLAKYENIVPEMNGGIWIRTAINRIREGLPPDGCLDDWWRAAFPDLAESGPIVPGCGLRRVRALSRRRMRRREYRRMQRLWVANMTKAARMVLDGDADNLPHPSLDEQTKFWKPVMEATSEARGAVNGGPAGPVLNDIWSPVSEREVISVRLAMASAPGPDRLMVRRWFTEVPAILRAAILNIFMAIGRVPRRFRDSRTILLPKSIDRLEPSYYRPISVSSVVLRHFHKILVTRLAKYKLIDDRQRAFISADGCAENVAALSAILYDAKNHFRQLHVVTLDVQKAFDTVSHERICDVLIKHGIPLPMVNYLRLLYSSAITRIQVGKQCSGDVRPGRGVRQGDPLSPFIFNLVMNEVLANIPDTIGYKFGNCNVNALAFADDLIVIGSTRRGTQLALDCVNRVLDSFGLKLAPHKCAAFSLIPSGKAKKLKVMTESQFYLDDNWVPQLGVLQTMRYLGVQFNCSGPTKGIENIASFLERIRCAPLKPQQRMKILRDYLVPRYVHSFVLGRVSHGALRKIDCRVRAAVRQWLRLPSDVPRGFFHAPIMKGGLGVLSFETTIPKLALKRLEGLSSSQLELMRIVAASEWADKRKRWCRIAKRQNDDWSAQLYSSVDGYELRQAGDVPASTRWLDDPMVHIPSSDWLQYIRTWINALPTRIRTTRGARRAHQDVSCRAGCGVQETAAHVIQQCFRTHGGRVLRHDAVATTVAGELDRSGYRVMREHLFQTAVGPRKPDIVAVKGSQGHILDVQIVSGARALSDAHKRKRQYYAGNDELMRGVAEKLRVARNQVKTSTVTLTWRGIWASESVRALEGMGLSRSILKGITTRVLFGSFMNFLRFNQTTMVRNSRAYMHMSGWGPPQR